MSGVVSGVPHIHPANGDVTPQNQTLSNRSLLHSMVNITAYDVQSSPPAR